VIITLKAFLAIATGETRGGVLEIKANLARFLVKIMTSLIISIWVIWI